jgi:hypothetical protein
MFSFCSLRVKAVSANRKPVFSNRASGKILREAGRCVDVGEKNLPEGGRVLANRIGPTTQQTIRR